MEPSSSSNSSSSSSSSSRAVNSSNSVNSNCESWFGVNFCSLISLLLDYSSGIMSSSISRPDSQRVTRFTVPVTRPRFQAQSDSGSSLSSGCGGDDVGSEVSIRIIGVREQESSVGSVSLVGSSSSRNRVGGEGCDDICGNNIMRVGRIDMLSLDNLSPETRRLMDSDTPFNINLDGIDGLSGLTISEMQEVRRIAKWVNRILPFPLLLLLVFVHEHFKGVIVMIFTSYLMFKSNRFVMEQTALKGNRKVSALAVFSSASMLFLMLIYWWYPDDELLYPLAMLPPKATPSFFQAVFTILVNDILVRQAAMVLKCLLLIYYKNGRGHNFRRQGQMLTLVEHTLLLYRALLPAPVWLGFFFNEEDYGTLFSLLTSSLYLTLKILSAPQEVRCFFSALKALAIREVPYGVYATADQVNDAGEICAICHEMMRSPILLQCNHIFCEDCVCEWFEREWTCPLCRAPVSRPNHETFENGSTTMYYRFY